MPRELHSLVPAGVHWECLGVTHFEEVAAVGWFHVETNTQALSSIILARLPRSGRTGPQWHVSVVDRTNRDPARPTTEQFLLARCAFGLLTAEEDNHHPGRARHLFYPVDPTERVDCECKSDEVVVREADGYEWTNPVDGPCRGCDLETTMALRGLVRPCPIHSSNRAIEVQR